jgi:lysophospholipase L1-like esterase
VDGKFVGSQLAVTPSGAAGATRFIRVDFPAAGRRRVELELGGCDIEGVYIPQTGSVWAAPPKGPKAICVGDSYTESSGDYTNMDSWVTAFADTMGWENVWNSGIGSTGWAKESATGANNSIEDRVAVTVNAYSPDVVFFLAGYNDRAVDSAPYTTTKNAVTAALSSVRAALPDALIIVGLNTAHSPVDGSVDTVYKPIQDAINASAGPYADILLDTASAGLFTGSGTTSAPSGSGNSDVYLDVTNHPMKAGQRYLGQRLAHMVINQLTAL